MEWILFVQVVLFGVAYFPVFGQQSVLIGYVLPQVEYQGIYGGSEKYAKRSDVFDSRLEGGRFRYFREARIGHIDDRFGNSVAISPHILLIDLALHLSFWSDSDPALQKGPQMMRHLSRHFEAITNDLTGLQSGFSTEERG